MTVAALNKMIQEAEYREFNKRTQPPLPKNTGKMRVNSSGMGTLTKKCKSIKQLLAEDEAMN